MVGLDNSLPTKNFLTRIQELKLESGATGAARIRRIPLYSDVTQEASVVDKEGNFERTAHIHLADGQTDKIYYMPVILPTDFIRGGFPSIHWRYTNGGTTGDILWVVRVIEQPEDTNDEVSILVDTTARTIPGVANTMTEISVDFTIIPNRNSTISALIQRTGGDGLDTNTSQTDVWSAWIEYIAHS